jgi:hypothetical protein
MREQTMQLARVGVVAAAILTVATAWAPKPNFSGTWTLDPSTTPAGAGARGGGALGTGPVTVTHTAETLRVERTMNGTPIRLSYQLDGRRSRNVLVGRDGQRADALSTAWWDGPRLTIVTRRDVGGRVMESRHVWTMAGSTLTVETTNASGTRTRIYRKQRGRAPGAADWLAHQVLPSHSDTSAVGSKRTVFEPGV